MLDLQYFASVREKHAAYESSRREVIKMASDALNASKRAIFALHRDDASAADQLLSDASAALDKVRALISKIPDLVFEGSYRAALEEFVESSLYRQYLRDGNVGEVKGDHIDYEIYLGGLTDLAGEIQRRQVRLATEGKLDEVKKCKDAIEEIIIKLLEMDLGGYLRTKFDQAKNSLRRAEEVLYETTIRRS